MTKEEKLSVLKIIAHTLNQADITWALGSSSFLYLKGLVSNFNDFDLFIAHGQGKAAEKLLASLGNEEPSNYKPGQYGTPLFCEFSIQGVEVDMALLQNANKVTVKVANDANKTEIKDSFQRLYQVKVVDVKIINARPKAKSRGGRYQGFVSGYKKAIVSIAKGSAIDLFKA